MSYENLDEEEKEKVKMILYIMDRFSISLDGYHEHTLLKAVQRHLTANGKLPELQEWPKVQNCL